MLQEGLQSGLLPEIWLILSWT